jgi:hypothetical protein
MIPENIKKTVAIAVHNVWMKNKLAQGYVYGTVTDSNLKTHSDLIEFDKLPESAQKYDYDTATTTLEELDRNGYTLIEKSELEELRKVAIKMTKITHLVYGLLEE